MADTTQKSFRCSVITPHGTFFEGDVVRVTLPSESGQITVLAHHEAFIALAKEGVAELEGKDGALQRIKIRRGIVEIQEGGYLILLLESARHA